MNELFQCKTVLPQYDRDFVLLLAPKSFSIGDIRRAVPGVSDQTIRLVLTELKASAQVTVDGTGRGTMWSRV